MFVLVICLGSPAVLSCYCLLVPISHPWSLGVLFICYMPAFLSCPGSPAVLLSYCMPALAVFTAFSLSCLAYISCCGISILLLPLFVLGLPLFLRSLPLRIFKQFLSEELWTQILTSLTKPLFLFPALDAYNLDNNNGLHNLTNTNKFKQGYDITFINFRLLASNHDWKKMNLSFASCRCPDTVKFNWSW